MLMPRAYNVAPRIIPIAQLAITSGTQRSLRSPRRQRPLAYTLRSSSMAARGTEFMGARTHTQQIAYRARATDRCPHPRAIQPNPIFALAYIRGCHAKPSAVRRRRRRRRSARRDKHISVETHPSAIARCARSRLISAAAARAAQIRTQIVRHSASAHTISSCAGRRACMRVCPTLQQTSEERAQHY